MNHRYAVVCRYSSGCRLFHWETASKEEAVSSLSGLRVKLRIMEKEHRLIQADIFQLSQNCLYTFHTPFKKEFKDILEVILVDGNIFHAPITGDLEESGNRLGQFKMTLAHAETRPDLYPFVLDL